VAPVTNIRYVRVGKGGQGRSKYGPCQIYWIPRSNFPCQLCHMVHILSLFCPFSSHCFYCLNIVLATKNIYFEYWSNSLGLFWIMLVESKWVPDSRLSSYSVTYPSILNVGNMNLGIMNEGIINGTQSLTLTLLRKYYTVWQLVITGLSCLSFYSSSLPWASYWASHIALLKSMEIGGSKTIWRITSEPGFALTVAFNDKMTEASWRK